MPTIRHITKQNKINCHLTQRQLGYLSSKEGIITGARISTESVPTADRQFHCGCWEERAVLGEKEGLPAPTLVHQFLAEPCSIRGA